VPEPSAAGVGAAGAFAGGRVLVGLRLLRGPAERGQVDACLFAVSAAASLLAGRLQSRVSTRVVLTGGPLVAIVGLVTLLGINGTTGRADLAWRLVIVGAGCGTVVAASTAVAVQSVAPELAGMAGTANNVLRQLGGALGAAVIGGIFAARLSAGTGYAGAVHICATVLIGILAATAAAVGGLLFARRVPVIHLAAARDLYSQVQVHKE
jgi:MFS family permease